MASLAFLAVIIPVSVSIYYSNLSEKNEVLSDVNELLRVEVKSYKHRTDSLNLELKKPPIIDTLYKYDTVYIKK